MHGLSVSKNDVALDILISRDCLASLCKLLDTGMRPDEAPQNSEELVLNAIDCIWSIVGAQSLISKMTSCYTLLALQITQRMLHAMAGLIKLGTARNDNAKLTADEDKFAPHYASTTHSKAEAHNRARSQSTEPWDRRAADAGLNLLAAVPKEHVHARDNRWFVLSHKATTATRTMLNMLHVSEGNSVH